MALIGIKGRKEPITVDNETAKRIKRRKFGDFHTGEGKAENTDLVDLDIWAGEYGQIKYVELDKARPVEEQRKAVYAADGKSVKIVPLNYKLLTGEKLA